MQGDSYPDHIDPDQHVDGVIAGDALEHAIGGVVAGFAGHVLWEGDFVHAEGALGEASRGSGCRLPEAQAGMAFKMAKSTEGLPPAAVALNPLVAGSRGVRGSGGSGQRGSSAAGGVEAGFGAGALYQALQVFSYFTHRDNRQSHGLGVGVRLGEELGVVVRTQGLRLSGPA